MDFDRSLLTGEERTDRGGGTIVTDPALQEDLK